VGDHRQWHLAPRDMGWEGKTLAEICAQIKDPARLVGWAWAPGFGRSPAPGTQPQARALAEAWAESGARVAGYPAGFEVGRPGGN
jgi:hypothetical protein